MSQSPEQEPPHNPAVFWFRQAAPYIHAYRNRVVVVMLPGEAIQAATLATQLQDLALLSSLGLKVVLVFGARPQIDERLDKSGIAQHYHHGLRVTDNATLGCVLEAYGRLQIDLEARLSMGLINSPMHGADLRVCSGNDVLARPVGVVEGVDMLHTGFVRKVRSDDILQALEQRRMVLVPSLGYAPTGEIFNLACEDVASALAMALGAEKLVMFADEETGLDRSAGVASKRQLSLAEAVQRLEALPSDSRGARTLLAACRVLRQCVPRVHLLDYHVDGCLLQELFTRDGAGILISDNHYDRIRLAGEEDLDAISRLIAPLEAAGQLVPRSRDMLAARLGNFLVEDRDGTLISCAALQPYPDQQCGELECLAVAPDFRRAGHGDRLLVQVIQRARSLGLTHLFVMTTQTAHWFLERGFQPSEVTLLPKEKQQLVNLRRNAKVFMLDLRAADQPAAPAPAGPA